MLTLLTVFFINASSTPGATGPEKSFSLEGGKTVNLTQISFTGNEAVSTAQLQKLVNPFLNKPFSESDLFELKQRITLLYQSKGYDDVEITIPADKQKAGSLLIKIKEGKAKTS